MTLRYSSFTLSLPGCSRGKWVSRFCTNWAWVYLFSTPSPFTNSASINQRCNHTTVFQLTLLMGCTSFPCILTSVMGMQVPCRYPEAMLTSVRGITRSAYWVFDSAFFNIKMLVACTRVPYKKDSSIMETPQLIAGDEKVFACPRFSMLSTKPLLYPLTHFTDGLLWLCISNRSWLTEVVSLVLRAIYWWVTASLFQEEVLNESCLSTVQLKIMF